jgi:hypothetical protein
MRWINNHYLALVPQDTSSDSAIVVLNKDFGLFQTHTLGSLPTKATGPWALNVIDALSEDEAYMAFSSQNDLVIHPVAYHESTLLDTMLSQNEFNLKTQAHVDGDCTTFIAMLESPDVDVDAVESFFFDRIVPKFKRPDIDLFDHDVVHAIVRRSCQGADFWPSKVMEYLLRSECLCSRFVTGGILKPLMEHDLVRLSRIY